jgi:hypothetical protein
VAPTLRFESIAYGELPIVGSSYLFEAILTPFLALSLDAVGLNLLTGYAGQVSLGSAAFMAVGAFAAYNFNLRVHGLPLLASLVLTPGPPLHPSTIWTATGAKRAPTPLHDPVRWKYAILGNYALNGVNPPCTHGAKSGNSRETKRSGNFQALEPLWKRLGGENVSSVLSPK